MEEAASIVGIQPTRPTSGSLPITRRPFPMLCCLPPPVYDCIRRCGLDWFVILWIGAVTLSLDKWMPNVGGNHRYFRIPSAGLNNTSSTYASASASTASTASSTFSPLYFGASELDHPARRQIIPFWLSAVLEIGIPGFVVGLLNLICNNGSMRDCARAMLGVVNSLLICCFFQVIMKVFIGGFRPGFLELCRPRPGVHHGMGYDGTYFKSEICTGDHNMIAWGLESFPSGHVATACGAAVFLSLYLNAKLKIFADYRANPLLIVLCLSPLVLAVLMAGAISIDMVSHPFMFPHVRETCVFQEPKWAFLVYTRSKGQKGWKKSKKVWNLGPGRHHELGKNRRDSGVF
ncbi:hypothetical protein TWF970_007506 [Orbilia oligospora]|uniref:Phosphatidic acid phosphatase type 2/haloperoxidase domain-containing protein n=1 Tax=Orbilia oligospora TaxID=2813651 RepID=A0A7C8VBG4_ORBOL|nr:hypothetical protein TWF970_007506 [Orbilia oligospora]